MSLTFTEEGHKYQSIEDDGIDWVSATGLISYFKGDFDPMTQSVKSSKNKKSKWYGMTPLAIRTAWEKESKRATDLGTWYHNQREADLCALDTIGSNGRVLNVYRPNVVKGIKYAPDQKLAEGMYPEHLAYLKSAGITGQSDKVAVVINRVNVGDYKTSKVIDEVGYTNWEGITSKMKAPLNHLDDCHLNHYALQLSLYMYIILKHNPDLFPGTLTIEHIIFEEAGRDEFDYPITARDINGDPILKEIVYHDLPYLKSEVIGMLNFLKNNRHLFLNKKKQAA